MSLDETVMSSDLSDLLWVFGCSTQLQVYIIKSVIMTSSGNVIKDGIMIKGVIMTSSCNVIDNDDHQFSLMMVVNDF